MCDIVIKKFTFVISSPDEFLYNCRQHCAHRIAPVFRLLMGWFWVFPLRGDMLHRLRTQWGDIWRRRVDQRSTVPRQIYPNRCRGGVLDPKLNILLKFRNINVPWTIFSERTTLRSVYAISRPSVVCRLLSVVCLWRWCTLLRRLNFSPIFFTIR